MDIRQIQKSEGEKRSPTPKTGEQRGRGTGKGESTELAQEPREGSLDPNLSTVETVPNSTAAWKKREKPSAPNSSFPPDQESGQINARKGQGVA